LKIKRVASIIFLNLQHHSEAIEPLEVEFRRDERVMRYLTVKLDKHALAWAEKRRKRNKAKA